MVEETPRLGLHTYGRGDEGWDHTDTVEALDEHAIVRGPLAERPSEGRYDDELYHATDQGTTWRWDRSTGEWSYFGGREPTWNVEAHGITGDGETKVGQAVCELLETVDESGGGIVFFPPGRYLFERTVLIGDNTVLMGAGRSTVFDGPRPAGEQGRALLSNRGYDRPDYDGASNWSVCNVRIDAPDANGILPAHAENVRLENIYGDAIYYHHLDVVSSKNVVVDGYWATRGGAGDSDAPIQFDSQNTGTAANGVWDGSTSTLVKRDGTPTRNCALRDFEIDPANNPEYGVHIHRDGHESLTIENGYITGCQYSAIRGDTGATMGDITIAGVSCIENGRGITLGEDEQGRRELTVSDVTIRTEDDELAAGSGLYASGFDSASLSNVTVDGPFTNVVLFDDMADLKLTNVTATGGNDQAFRFRENVDVTLTAAHAADCGGAGIYVGPGSSAAYGGVTFDDVGSTVVVDGETREWVTSSTSS
ncbi:MAG: glycosyl hydrolase family 28-related protein [Haloarculaceae archaeon]